MATQKRIPQKIKDECKAFVIEKKLPVAQYGILLNLALKSYKAMPIMQRDKWSLEQIVEQGL